MSTDSLSKSGLNSSGGMIFMVRISDFYKDSLLLHPPVCKSCSGLASTVRCPARAHRLVHDAKSFRKTHFCDRQPTRQGMQLRGKVYS